MFWDIGQQKSFCIPKKAFCTPKKVAPMFHGDDFLAEGHDSSLHKLDEVLGAFEIKRWPRTGPTAGRERVFLHRTIRWKNLTRSQTRGCIDRDLVIGRTRDPVATPSGIFSYTPEPHIAFCPIFVHQLFPAFEPLFQKWIIFVRVTLLDSNLRPSAEKRSNLAPTPSSSLARTTTIELPECQERRGAKTIKSVFFEKASAGRRPATPSQEHGLCPTFGVSAALSVEHCRP